MAKKERILSIDQFRGFAVVTMVIANFIGGVQDVPAWLKHAPDIGLTVIDLIAPFFIFAVALNYGRSLSRRLDEGNAVNTYTHFFMRGMALVGLGFFFSAGEQWTGYSTLPVMWGVLQAIGLACVLCLPFMRLNWIYRAVIAIAALSAYQFALNNWWLKDVLASSHGGILGAFSWSAMMLLSTAMADLFENRKRKDLYLITASVLIAAALTAAVWFPISKNRVSPSYVLLTTGISAFLYYLFYLLNDIREIKIPLLSDWGINPLALYILHQILLAVFVFPPVVFQGALWWYDKAPAWLTVLQLFAFLGILSAVAAWLGKKRILIKI
jgi:predicted acyltransferase